MVPPRSGGTGIGPTPNPLPEGKGLEGAVQAPLPWREEAGG